MRHFYQPEQPFDRNLAHYTMKVRCLEAPDLMPDDSTKKIFLYTFGDSRGESPEMVRFLKYLQNPSNTAGDTLLEEISRAVQYEKQSPRAKGAYRMYSLWYSDTYGKTKQRALQRVKPGTVSGWQCASSLKTGLLPRWLRISTWTQTRSAASRRPWKRCTSPV